MLARTVEAQVEESKIDTAVSLVDMLRSAAADINEQRALPADILGDMRTAGLVGLLKPSRFGGEDVSLAAAMKVSRELARGDASAAWVHAVYTTHDFLLGYFPAEAQEEYWNSADIPLCASSFVPTGRARAVDGGWELSGEWSFCSGIDHADWTVVGAITGMIPGEVPVPDRQLFLVPSSDYTIVDDWHVMGLRGTGSKSIRLDTVFVPSRRAVRDFDLVKGPTAGAGAQEAPEYRYPVWPLLTFGLVGLAARIAQNAYESSIGEILAGAGKPNPLFESRRSAAALHLAEASAKIDAADLLFLRALDETLAVVSAGEELTMARRVRNRRDQCFSARLALEAVSTLLSIGGARGLREGALVQRAFRDLNALSLHPSSNWDSAALSFGNVEMGGRPTEPFA